MNIEKIGEMEEKLLYSQNEIRNFGSFLESEAHRSVWAIMLFLRATSQTEIVHKSGISQPTVSRAINDLLRWRIIKLTSTIPNPKGSGNAYEIITIRNSLPQDTIEATKRLLKLIKPNKTSKTIQNEELRREPIEQAQHRHEETKQFFAEYSKDKIGLFKHHNFRDWIIRNKNLDFNTAKEYADTAFGLGLVIG